MSSGLQTSTAQEEPAVPPLAAEAIRIVVADQHAPTRRRLTSLLEGEAGLEVVAEAGDADSATRLVHGHRPQVLVIELSESAGDRPGIEAIRGLSERVQGTRIVVLAEDENPVFAQRALTAGASAYVAGDLAQPELAQAVRAAATGEEWISPRVAARLDALHRSLTGNKLTQREIEVLRLIAFGHTSVEIARTLHLSPRTIETHRAHIHKKLGLASRAELVRYALRRGLVCA